MGMDSTINPFQLRQAVRHLHKGGVLAYPTEAVWGLGADPFNEQACRHLLALKRRPADKGVILVAGSIEQLDFLLFDLPPELLAKLTASWPGANTWLVPHHGRVPAWVHGAHDTVAVRVSAHRGVQQLCHAFAGPLVSTSANRAGEAPISSAFQLHCRLGHQVRWLPGQLGGARQPSTIRHLITDRIYR